MEPSIDPEEYLELYSQANFEYHLSWHIASYFSNMSRCRDYSFSVDTLRVVSATFLLVCFLVLNKSTCQTRENVFYFTSKAHFVLEKIKF